MDYFLLDLIEIIKNTTGKNIKVVTLPVGLYSQVFAKLNLDKEGNYPLIIGDTRIEYTSNNRMEIEL